MTKSEQEHIGSVAMGDSRETVTDGMVAKAKTAYWHEVHNGGGYSDKCYEAAIAAALSRPAQEPVAWGNRLSLSRPKGGVAWERVVSVEKRPSYDVPLYAAPQPAHGTSATERVASDHGECGGPQKLAAKYMVATGLSQEKADAIALLLSRTIGFVTSSPAPNAVTAGQGAEAWNELCTRTFAVQHNPNCPSPWLVRLPGKGPIDMLPYGDPLRLVKHQTGDILGFGKTLEEAAHSALSTPTPKEGE